MFFVSNAEPKPFTSRICKCDTFAMIKLPNCTWEIVMREASFGFWGTLSHFEGTPTWERIPTCITAPVNSSLDSLDSLDAP